MGGQSETNDFLISYSLANTEKIQGAQGLKNHVLVLVLLTLGLWLASDHLGIWRTLRGASKTRGVRQLLEGFEAKQVTRIFKN